MTPVAGTIEGLFRIMMGIRLAALSGSAAAAALMVFASPTAAMAQQQTYRFDLPAQTLGSALRAFGQASRQQIIFSEDDVRGRDAPSLVGSYTVDAGLDRLLAGSGLSVQRTSAGVITVGKPIERIGAFGQGDAAPEASDLSELVVTGSRIRRTDTATAAPVTMLDEEALIERGYVNLGELLNQVTSNVPSFPISVTQGFPAGAGKTSPNLFNLGAGRTLTLVNGRRMVTSSSGFGDRTVDSNVIPSGLIKRVDIVQAGGAAVYGSDAIAGVVNYILKDNFEGLELDAQYGESSEGDYPKRSFRATYGLNFHEDRGNVAVNFEYSKTRPLLESARRRTGEGIRNVPNPANTSTSDGIPPTMWVSNGRLWQRWSGLNLSVRLLPIAVGQ